MRRGILAGLAALCLLLPGARVVQADDPPRPNIVIFYIDDAAPLDGRLWSNTALTPTIADYFVGHGTNFANAIGETPMCCPGRGGLLTGLHTQNHGVIWNDARMFNPREHVGAELKAAGYATMWIGKYLNSNDKLSSTAWRLHGKGWTFLDAVYGENGKYFNYKVHTKSGSVSYGNLHSTRMAAERTVQRMRTVDPSKPIFSVVSMYNMHVPNVPMPGFENDPRWDMCAEMPPWAPPNYNEADVSDKPAWVRNLPLLPDADGYPMKGYCREMLGVDWAVKKVIDELAAEGRLDNSLLIFTADNGVGWGEHRVGRKKVVPYATRVPLYMSWPERWGDAPREIDDLVSNIDLAPTLCELAGCEMGPFPTGQEHADGLSLLRLLDGDANHIPRKAVLESAWGPDVRDWRAIRTATDHLLGAWHYVEWQNGERELYDLTADPWELTNRAGQQAYLATQNNLAYKLAQLDAEGVDHQPDASIKRKIGSKTEWLSDGVYVDHAAAKATLRRRVDPANGANFIVRIDNDSGATDTIEVTCTLSGTPYATIDFTNQSATCADGVTVSTYTIPALRAHFTTKLTFRITLPEGTPPGGEAQLVVHVQSVTDPEGVDVVRAVAYQ
ncbi:MAG: sulfatase-like hydrolase/transferase [Chloroflexota bacterium]